LQQNAVPVVLALGLMVPLIANEFDLSVAAVLGLGSVLAAGLPTNQGFGAVEMIAAVLAMGAAVGTIHAVLIVRLGLPSFVVTLGTSSLLGGLIVLYSDNQTIFEPLPALINDLGTGHVLGIDVPILVVVVLTAVLWFVLDQRPAGRLMYATGAAEDAARLAGVPTARVRTIALISGSTISAFAGLLLTAQVGAADPTHYSQFFLPAFAAAFLSIAGFKLGHYNPLGVVAAVYLLAVGINGLELLGAPTWVQYVFNGGALLLAIGASRALRITRRVEVM
jgi:ribose transport system permease protein